MAGSQQTFDAVINRFKDGNVLVQGWGDYSPSNNLIKKPALMLFITSVEGSNTLVDTTEGALDTQRNIRGPLVFEIKLTNPTCLETRIRGIHSYLKSDPDNTAFKSAAKSVGEVLKKMRPQYKKQAEGAPRGAGKSPSEKSFASAVGQGQKVITIITGLGLPYAPADANLNVVNMTALVNSIETGNENVQKAMEDYGVANKARLKLYEGIDGLKKRRSAILSYLASFPGLKKSDHYREYNQAIKGT